MEIGGFLFADILDPRFSFIFYSRSAASTSKPGVHQSLLKILLFMRALQQAFPAFRGFASTPARFASNSAATHLPVDIMGKKRNESAGNGTGEGESPSPLSMKDFQVYNRLSVQMDQFVSPPNQTPTNSP